MHPTTIKRTASTAFAAVAIAGGAGASSAQAIPADAWPRHTTRVHIEPAPPSRPPVIADGATGLDVSSLAIGAAGTGVVILMVGAAALGTRRQPQF